MRAPLIPSWFWWLTVAWIVVLLVFPDQVFEGIRYASVPFYALALMVGAH